MIEVRKRGTSDHQMTSGSSLWHSIFSGEWKKLSLLEELAFSASREAAMRDLALPLNQVIAGETVGQDAEMRSEPRRVIRSVRQSRMHKSNISPNFLQSFAKTTPSLEPADGAKKCSP